MNEEQMTEHWLFYEWLIETLRPGSILLRKGNGYRLKAGSSLFLHFSAKGFPHALGFWISTDKNGPIGKHPSVTPDLRQRLDAISADERTLELDLRDKAVITVILSYQAP